MVLKYLRRRSLAAAAVLALLLSMFFSVVASPAHAEDSPNGFCPDSAPEVISWSSGYFPWHTASWGRARVCSNQPSDYKHILEFQVEDTLTDGYCVHVEIYAAGVWIPTTYNSGDSTTSCGAAVSGSSGWISPAEILSARLIRGTGTPGVGVNYMTIWTHP